MYWVLIECEYCCLLRVYSDCLHDPDRRDTECSMLASGECLNVEECSILASGECLNVEECSILASGECLNVEECSIMASGECLNVEDCSMLSVRGGSLADVCSVSMLYDPVTSNIFLITLWLLGINLNHDPCGFINPLSVQWCSTYAQLVATVALVSHIKSIHLTRYYKCVV